MRTLRRRRAKFPRKRFPRHIACAGGADEFLRHIDDAFLGDKTRGVIAPRALVLESRPEHHNKLAPRNACMDADLATPSAGSDPDDSADECVPTGNIFDSC